ncbi:MAG TPA: glycosyltransferase family 4 protein [Polyangia bacterium]|nr:glycosyltransferase family 4 protein [Polyangia bacterium]
MASCDFDADLQDLEPFFERYHAMTGWAEAVAGAGAAVTVVQRFRRDAVVRRGPVEYRFVAYGGTRSPLAWALGTRLVREIGATRPDAVHVDGLVFPGLVGCLRARLPRRAAIVVQDHGGAGVEAGGMRNPAKRLLYGAGLGAADGFMFTARAQAEPWLSAGVIRARHAVYEVPESSTDMASWGAAADAGAGLPGRPAMLWVGRLDTNKDPLTVLDGFARAAPSLPDAALTLVYGDDVELPAVQAWLGVHPELRARVHLRGRLERKALPALYRSADIFVLGSHREVACFSLIEALSCGVTPVVTDIPAFRTLTAGGRIGVLFAPGNADALARAIVTASQGDAGARRRSVRAHFEGELSWPAVGARALAAYRSAAAARRAKVGARWPA